MLRHDSRAIGLQGVLRNRLGCSGCGRLTEIARRAMACRGLEAGKLYLGWAVFHKIASSRSFVAEPVYDGRSVSLQRPGFNGPAGASIRFETASLTQPMRPALTWLQRLSPVSDPRQRGDPSPNHLDRDDRGGRGAVIRRHHRACCRCAAALSLQPSSPTRFKDYVTSMEEPEPICNTLGATRDPSMRSASHLRTF